MKKRVICVLFSAVAIVDLASASPVLTTQFKLKSAKPAVKAHKLQEPVDITSVDVNVYDKSGKHKLYTVNECSQKMSLAPLTMFKHFVSKQELQSMLQSRDEKVGAFQVVYHYDVGQGKDVTHHLTQSPLVYVKQDYVGDFTSASPSEYTVKFTV